MKRNVVALACGALFGAGACVSGMTRPSKVLAFLDVGGAWDPTLMVVMAVAMAVMVVAWRVVAARSGRGPVCGGGYPEAASTVIDARLIGGSALFGLGWGIAGFCPGPAMVAVVSGARDTLVFVAAMVAAMAVMRLVERAGEDEPIG
jgi:uncharacterized membrane protein YedE/YeeE